RGFEGGQTPLHRRLPKFGFTNALFKKAYVLLTFEDLENLGSKIDLDVLNKVYKAGPYKLLSKGNPVANLNLTINKISKSAKDLIEKNGGKV
ncbi:MAG: uL15 family ribosomal protein, partial [Bdellovibrionaceae bacterium]|nr:uL15 family ribosomal protein [Pseudobdellovibrionaceae bacterium]